MWCVGNEVNGVFAAVVLCCVGEGGTFFKQLRVPLFVCEWECGVCLGGGGQGRLCAVV